MSRHSPFVIMLSDEERRVLETRVRKRTAEHRQVVRAQIVLAAADGEENATIAARLGVALNTVIKWRKRFFEEGMDGLEDRPRSGRPPVFSPSGRGRGQSLGLRASRPASAAPVSVQPR